MNSTTTKQSDMLATQSGIEKIPSNESVTITEREQIKNTPFWLIKKDNGKWVATLMKYQITPEQETQGDVLRYIDENEWNIVTIIAEVIHIQIANDVAKWTEESRTKKDK